MKISCYASIQEITGKENHVIDSNPKSVADLCDWLVATWPALNDATFVIAVNRKIISDKDHPISENDEVALLPPFSGG